MKKIAGIFIIILLVFSSCSSKKYGHYRYSKKKTIAAKVKKSKKRNKYQIVELNTINTTNSNIEKAKITRTDSIELARTNSVKENSKPSNQTSFQIPENSTRNDVEPKKYLEKNSSLDDEEKKPNKLASTAFYLAMGALFFSLISIGLPFMGIIGLGLGIAAFIIALKALKEFEKNPELYSNRAMAVAALVIGIIYLVLLLITIIAIGIFFLILLSL